VPEVTLTERYGSPDAGPAAENPTLALQLAHRSVRQFLSEPVTEEQLTALVAAAQRAERSLDGAD
jgi:hypothetical protein